MILYDKKNNFLGMSQSELSMLGYEDLAEFKSYYDDFADLFVEHPGYISNFKNFSWIDYALHSGAPSKNVILKHKNGTEVEAELIISEIFLMNPINDTLTAYCIEIHTLVTSSGQDFLNIQDDDKEPLSLNINNDSKILNTIKTEKMPLDNFDDILDKNETLNDMNQMFKTESITDEIEDNIDSLKDNFISQSPQSTISADETDLVDRSKPAKNEPKEEQIKLKVTFNDELLQSNIETAPYFIQEETTEISKQISIKENSLDLNDDKKDIYQDSYEDIDFTQIAEETGIDLSDIAEFISDFIDESKNYIKNLNDSMNSSDYSFIKNEAIKLKGVASNLKMEKITETLSTIIENKNGDKLDAILKLFQKQIKNLEEQLS